MITNVSPLFQPFSIGSFTLRNRIVMPPMVVARGHGTPEGIAWYGARARGGTGLVIVEATRVPLFGERLNVANLRPLVDAIHDGGAAAAIQLFPKARGHDGAPNGLDARQIDDLIADCARAAAICREAGFDGVEVHGAHGYFLNQFFSPTLNTRADAYGGSLENRSRLALRIVRAVRPVLGADRLLLYRHTPERDGYGIADSLLLAEALVSEGVDVLDLSPSSVATPGDHAAPFRTLGVPLIAVNGLDTVERALEVLAHDRADLVAVGRGLIADPEWPNKVREGRLDEITACIQCDNCHVDLYAGRPVACSQWPA